LAAGVGNRLTERIQHSIGGASSEVQDLRSDGNADGRNGVPVHEDAVGEILDWKIRLRIIGGLDPASHGWEMYQI
jgi:hypothetical protein